MTLLCSVLAKNSIPAEKSLEWRRVNEVDTILERYTPSQVFKKYFSCGQIGIDKFGCPGNTINGFLRNYNILLFISFLFRINHAHFRGRSLYAVLWENRLKR
jgi:hypothetical protein